MQPHASFPLNFMPSNSKTSRQLPSLFPRQQQPARQRAYTLDGSDLVRHFNQYGGQEEEPSDQVINGAPTNNTHTITDNYATSGKTRSNSNADSSSEQSYGVDDLHRDSEVLTTSHVPSLQSSATQSLVVADSAMTSSLCSTTLPSSLNGHQQQSPSKSAINIDSSNESNNSNVSGSKVPSPRMDVNLNLTDSVITENTEALERALFGSRGDGEGASLTNSLLNVSGPPPSTINTTSHQLHQDHHRSSRANQQPHPPEALQHRDHHQQQDGHQLNYNGNNSQLASVDNKHKHVTLSEDCSNSNDEITPVGLAHNAIDASRVSSQPSRAENSTVTYHPTQSSHNSTRTNSGGSSQLQHTTVMSTPATNTRSEGRQAVNDSPAGRVTFGGTITIPSTNSSTSPNGVPVDHTTPLNSNTSHDHTSDDTGPDNTVRFQHHSMTGTGNPLQPSWNASLSSDVMTDRCSVEGDSCTQSPAAGYNTCMAASNVCVTSPALTINDSNVDHVSSTPMDHTSSSRSRDHVSSNNVEHQLEHTTLPSKQHSDKHGTEAHQMSPSLNIYSTTNGPSPTGVVYKDGMEQQHVSQSTPISQRGAGVGTSMLFTSSPLPPITSPEKKDVDETAAGKPVEMSEGV